MQSLPARKPTDHKGKFGHVLIVGGNYGFGGSVRLAGEAALRSGAGLVSIATTPEHAYSIMGNCPELMCHGIVDSKDLDPLLDRVTTIVIGPGLGQSEWGEHLLKRILLTSLPLVVDADGLNILSKIDGARHHWVLTPHPGEASHLLKQSTADIQKDRLGALLKLQSHFGGIIVLKGAGTLITDEKQQIWQCGIENPVLATGGTGDVLSGVIGALIAQGLSLIDAAKLAVIVHATAADIISENEGNRGMKASDLFDPIHFLLNSQ